VPCHSLGRGSLHTLQYMCLRTHLLVCQLVTDNLVESTSRGAADCTALHQLQLRGRQVLDKLLTVVTKASGADQGAVGESASKEARRHGHRQRRRRRPPGSQGQDLRRRWQTAGDRARSLGIESLAARSCLHQSAVSARRCNVCCQGWHMACGHADCTSRATPGRDRGRSAGQLPRRVATVVCDAQCMSFSHLC
jgi:hypothetical protein